ncbi:hypothetical protein ABZ896_51300 [Streptomyces sp. NPDC047072]|uniref:hypothetical protein n=1 Tax=Streptomyces sp. NPDC047072 TaxID=3154809 RepID=UPI0033E2A259
MLRLGALAELGAVPADEGIGTDSRWASTSRRPVPIVAILRGAGLTSCSPTWRTPPYNRDHNRARAPPMLTRWIAQAHGRHRAPGRSSPAGGFPFTADAIALRSPNWPGHSACGVSGSAEEFGRALYPPVE